MQKEIQSAIQENFIVVQLNFGGDRQALNAIHFVTRVWGPVSMTPLIKSSSVFYSDGLRLGFI